LEGLGIENVVIFYDHSEYFTVIWYNSWPFGKVCGHLVYFPVLVRLDQDKSGNPGVQQSNLASFQNLLFRRYTQLDLDVLIGRINAL
jgi:hypothetical protein